MEKFTRIFVFINPKIFDGKNLKKKENLVIILLTVVFGIAALLFMLWITPFGAGVSFDSIMYLGGAKNILSGIGFFNNNLPISHFPPFFSILLAATGIVEKNPLQAARILNAILFAVNTGIFILTVYLTAGRNFLTTILAALLFIFSAQLIEIHAYAWSEPLFITLLLLSTLFLCLYVNKPRSSLLFATSISLGFAIITRYIGIALFPILLFIIFFSENNGKFGKSIRNTITCFLLTSLPLSILFVRNLMVSGSTTDRSFVIHPVPIFTYFTEIMNGIFNFFVPNPLPLIGEIAIFGLIVAILVFIITRYVKEIGWQLINWRSLSVIMATSSILFTLSYIIFLYISISSFDGSTPVNIRILSPIFVLLIPGIFTTIWTVSANIKKPILWSLFLVIVIITLILNMPSAITEATDIKENGLGYTSQQWNNSETLDYIKSLPEGIKIYSNGAEVINYLTDGQSILIPRKNNAMTMENNSLYDKQVDAMCKEINNKTAFLVYFDHIIRGNLPNQQEIELRCKLPILKDFGDGEVMGFLSR